MLNPPAALSQADVSAALTAWGLQAAALDYAPLGFGTHHWHALDPSAGRRFVNVDDLAARRLHGDEPLTAPLHRLRAALSVPRALSDLGYSFAIAPEPAQDGAVVRTIGRDDEYALSVYRHIAGQGYQWAAEGWASPQVVPEHLTAVLEMLAALHRAPATAGTRALTDDFAIPARDALESALTRVPGPASGPYATAAADLLATHADPLHSLLGRYDELAEVGRAQASRFVLTHGEPHPGNTMRGPDGYLLIDWDTTLVAPPERDLWNFAPEAVARYTEQSGITPDPALLLLYRLRWDLTDTALYAAQFRAPHTDSANDAASWANLVGTVERLAAAAR